MRVVRPDELPDLRIVEPEVHRDHRGRFMETWREERYRREVGIGDAFVQDNLARSHRGVLRGLHYQHPHSQGKLVQVVRGAVHDVAVDLRRGSPTHGHWLGVRLDADRLRQLWIPAGFAHGYLTLEGTTEVHYKCTETYHPEDAHALRWDDPELDIKWPLEEIGRETPVLSERDAAAYTLAELLEAGALPGGDA